MIVVDSSALIAILFNEPEARGFSRKISSSDDPVISAANFFEASMVAECRKKEYGTNTLTKISAHLGLQVVDFTKSQANIAVKAFCDYGKGRHPASLNMGDCFAYALAKDYDAPLLFKGEDFSKTDIKIANVNL